MKSKQTQALEADLASKKGAASALAEKHATFGEKIEKASFAKRPELREELADLRAELDRAKAATAAAEAPLARSIELDERADKIAEFRKVDAVSAAAGRAFREAVALAIRAGSEASAFAQGARTLAAALGGAKVGFAVSPEAIFLHEHTLVDSVPSGEIISTEKMLWPSVAVKVDAPSPKWVVGAVDDLTAAKFRALDSELAAREAPAPNPDVLAFRRKSA